MYIPRMIKLTVAYNTKIIVKWEGELNVYLSCRGRAEGEHVSQGRDDVHSEANEEGTNSGVDRSEEGEDDGKEPDGYDNRQPCKSTLTHAFAFMDPYRLLPHKIQRCACKPKSNELQPQHQLLLQRFIKNF